MSRSSNFLISSSHGTHPVLPCILHSILLCESYALLFPFGFSCCALDQMPPSLYSHGSCTISFRIVLCCTYAFQQQKLCILGQTRVFVDILYTRAQRMACPTPVFFYRMNSHDDDNKHEHQLNMKTFTGTRMQSNLSEPNMSGDGQPPSRQSVKGVRQGISIHIDGDGWSPTTARITPHYPCGHPCFIVFLCCHLLVNA